MADDPTLEDLIFLVLERRSSGDGDVLEQLCRAHPAHAPALREQVAQLEASGLLEDEPDAATAARIPERFGDFRLVRRIGHGGMGVVYLAEEPALGRRVALKVLRPEHVYFAQARERFRREARSVARLAHPGIVPLFASGEALGLPYFTMALVEGVSLAEVLRALQGRDPATLTGRDLFDTTVALTAERGFTTQGANPEELLFQGQWPAASAWLAREVAQALEHAHQRGVLHRDIKPSNVLLTPDGRVLLVDFGLATVQSVDRMTRSGAQLGSLPYMAPEQIAGDIAHLDARTDVYGLGVLLYEVLTLRLPYQEADVSRLGARIAAGDAPPLRRFHRGLPPDFETVCRTAMHVEPARRYASPAHVARDLSNLLGGRAIEARPPGLGESLWRYARRRPAHATAAALATLLVLGGPATVATLKARAAVELGRERDVARANLDAALEAVEVLLERVGHSELREVPRLERLRGELLTRATDLYSRLDATSGGELRARVRVASALGKLARLKQENGDREGALVGFTDAEVRLSALVAEAPDDPKVLFEYGNLLAFASVSRFPGDPRAAVEALGPAVVALRRAHTLDPNAPRPRAELARGLLALAHFLDLDGKSDAALERYAEAEVLARAQLENAPPESTEWYDAFELEASAQGRTANILIRLGEGARASVLMQGILARMEGLPKVSGYMRQLRGANIQTLVAERQDRDEPTRDTELDALLELGHTDALTLLREFPNNPRYVSNAGHSFVALGKRAYRFGELARARELFDEGARLHRDLVRQHADDPAHCRNLGLVLGRLADIDRDEGDEAARRARLREAFDAHALAVARGGQPVSTDEALTRARELMEQAARLDDVATLDEVAAALAEKLPKSFAAAVDAAQGVMLAARILELGGDLDAIPARREAAVGHLLRALELGPKRREVVADYAQKFGLTDEPALAAKLR